MILRGTASDQAKPGFILLASIVFIPNSQFRDEGLFAAKSHLDSLREIAAKES